MRICPLVGGGWKQLTHFLPSNHSPLWQSLKIPSFGGGHLKLLFEMLQLVKVNENAAVGQHKNHYIEMMRRVHGDLMTYITLNCYLKNKLEGY